MINLEANEKKLEFRIQSAELRLHILSYFLLRSHETRRLGIANSLNHKLPF